MKTSASTRRSAEKKGKSKKKTSTPDKHQPGTTVPSLFKKQLLTQGQKRETEISRLKRDTCDNYDDDDITFVKEERVSVSFVNHGEARVKKSERAILQTNAESVPSCSGDGKSSYKQTSRKEKEKQEKMPARQLSLRRRQKNDDCTDALLYNGTVNKRGDQQEPSKECEQPKKSEQRNLENAGKMQISKVPYPFSGAANSNCDKSDDRCEESDNNQRKRHLKTDIAEMPTQNVLVLDDIQTVDGDAVESADQESLVRKNKLSLKRKRKSLPKKNASQGFSCSGDGENTIGTKPTSKSTVFEKPLLTSDNSEKLSTSEQHANTSPTTDSTGGTLEDKKHENKNEPTETGDEVREEETVYRVPYYLENFNTVLKSVFGDEYHAHLFDESDLKSLEAYNSLTGR
jgi:hypothetical protein